MPTSQIAASARHVPVSVVVPCYRCTATLDRALASVFAQTAMPAELVLVDDASGDGTPALLNQWLQQYPDHIRLVSLPVNSGAGAARNAGWDIASQPYIAFLDSDDSWHPEKLRIQFGIMKAHPDVAISGHVCPLWTADRDQAITPESVQITPVAPASLLFRNPFSMPSVMLLKGIGCRFDSGKRYCEDFLLYQTIGLSGLKMAQLNTPLAWVHKPLYGSAGLSQQLWNMEKAELENFVALRRGAYVGRVACAVAMAFSLVKFFKRVCWTQARSWVKLGTLNE